MRCNTCEQTMQGFSAGWFWCSRCGTLRTGDGKQTSPTGVAAARAVLRQIADGPEDVGSSAVAGLRDAVLGRGE